MSRFDPCLGSSGCAPAAAKHESQAPGPFPDPSGARDRHSAPGAGIRPWSTVELLTRVPSTTKPRFRGPDRGWVDALRLVSSRAERGSGRNHRPRASGDSHPASKRPFCCTGYTPRARTCRARDPGRRRARCERRASPPHPRGAGPRQAPNAAPTRIRTRSGPGDGAPSAGVTPRSGAVATYRANAA